MFTLNIIHDWNRRDGWFSTGAYLSKQTKRAIRRHHYARKKAEASRRKHVPKNPRSIGMAAQTQADCSCAMCGNPRKWYDIGTMQERRLEDVRALVLEHEEDALLDYEEYLEAIEADLEWVYSYEPEGLGPEELGPEELGPEELGPEEWGPEYDPYWSDDYLEFNDIAFD